MDKGSKLIFFCTKKAIFCCSFVFFNFLHSKKEEEKALEFIRNKIIDIKKIFLLRCINFAKPNCHLLFSLSLSLSFSSASKARLSACSITFIFSSLLSISLTCSKFSKIFLSCMEISPFS